MRKTERNGGGRDKEAVVYCEHHQHLSKGRLKILINKILRNKKSSPAVKLWISKSMLLPRRKQKWLHNISLIFVLYKAIWWIWRVSLLTSLLSYCHHYQGSVKVLDDLNLKSSHQQISSADFYKLWQFQNKIFYLGCLKFTKSHFKAGFHMVWWTTKSQYNRIPSKQISLILWIKFKHNLNLYGWQYSFNKQNILCHDAESTYFSVSPTP